MLFVSEWNHALFVVQHVSLMTNNMSAGEADLWDEIFHWIEVTTGQTIETKQLYWCRHMIDSFWYNYLHRGANDPTGQRTPTVLALSGSFTTERTTWVGVATVKRCTPWSKKKPAPTSWLSIVKYSVRVMSRYFTIMYIQLIWYSKSQFAP